MFSTLLVLSSLPVFGFAFPAYARQDGGVVIVPPPNQTDTGLQAIPDADHPFQAPGPDDQRGPCPGLNTLANHGYIPRNGIASFEQIVQGVGAGFNMDPTLAGAATAFGMLARGNAFTNQLSIGGPSPLVPPLPGNIDGNVTKGLATHGRFEGDVSMTRMDAAIGDNRNFNEGLFDELVALVHEFGDDSDVTGPKSIVNVDAMAKFKFQRFVEDQKANPELQFHVGREILSYGESSFTLNFFANGTDGILTIPTMTSFFRDQTFPANWHRRSSPGDFSAIGATAGAVAAPFPVPPGANVDGIYVPDINNVSSTTCALYTNLGSENLPAILMETTGVLKQNVDTLLQIIYAPFSASCDFAPPVGEAGV